MRRSVTRPSTSLVNEAPAGLTRRPIVAFIAGLAALVLLVAPAVASPAAAAEPDDGLQLTSDTTYTLVPDQGLVHVTVAMTATNTKPNLVRETSTGTLTTRYFFESASLAVHAEATAIRASAGKTQLRTRTTAEDGFTILRVDFPSDIYFEQSAAFTVDYDLPGGEPRSDSDIRVGSAFATFYAWAFGDVGDVKILVPGGYDVETSGSTTRETAADGVTTIAATGISDPINWYTIVVANRPDALTSDRLDLADGEHLVIRAWPEDAEWRTRVTDLLEVGLPALVEKIGLPWPVEGDIEIAEVHTPLLEGYAGVFYPDADRIEISEDLDELTIVHEASHAWFNEELFVGRWIGEGLADEYASRVLDDVSIGGLQPTPVSRRSPAAIALNDWQPPGRIADEETQARETYAYEASWAVIRAIMREVGEDRMREVLVAANARRTAYVGAGEPETVGYPNDWRRFLDLLEEDGGSANATTLFEQTVVTDDEKPLLEERAEARRAYADLVAAGEGWLPGYAVRDPMGRWQFDRAQAEIDDAHEVLEARDQIEAAAEDLDLAPPPTLRAAYEGATSDYGSAQALADRQLVIEATLAEAGDRVAAERPPLTLIGLIGVDPDGAFASARSAFSAGNLDDAEGQLSAVDAMFDAAVGTGRERFVIGGGAALLLLSGGGAAVVLVRRRRRTPGGITTAHAAAVSPAGPTPIGMFAPPRPSLPGAPELSDPPVTLGGPRPDGALTPASEDVERERGDRT